MCGAGKDSRTKQTRPDYQSSVRDENQRYVGRLHEVCSNAVSPAGHAMTRELSTLPDEQGGVFREKIICSTSSSQQATAKQVANMAAAD
jgi:hypothetical protein